MVCDRVEQGKEEMTATALLSGFDPAGSALASKKFVLRLADLFDRVYSRSRLGASAMHSRFKSVASP